MTTARKEVLERVRTALAERPAARLVPRDYGRIDDARASIELFVERLRDYDATVHRCTSTQVAILIARIARGRYIVPELFPALWLAGYEAVSDHPRVTHAELDELTGVITTCTLGIAETGTIVLDAGSGQGRRALTLVPDHHVVIVLAEQVVATVPQALAQLDPRRPQTWISGPSATSDIELERVHGVHGPRRLEVVIVDSHDATDRD